MSVVSWTECVIWVVVLVAFIAVYKIALSKWG